MSEQLHRRTARLLKAAKLTEGVLGVVLVQFAPKLGAFEDNWGAIQTQARFVTQRYTPVDLIVFPELAFTGYELSRQQAEVLARTPDEMSFVANLALETGAVIVAGYVERCPTCPEGTLHNVAGVWYPDGKFETAHKWNLWGPDFYWAASGSSHPHDTIDISGVESHILICKDLRNDPPEWHSSGAPFAKRSEIRLTVAPTAWGKGEFPPGTWFNYVAESQTWLVVANRTGDEDMVGFQGGCMVISPAGEIRHSANPFAPSDILYSLIPVADDGWGGVHKVFPKKEKV